MSRNLAITRVYGVAEETVTAATTFLTSQVAHLYRWWESCSRGRRLPLRREFDVADHPSIVPDLFLVEALPNGDFLMKLEGENVIELFGVNNTGQAITQAAGAGEYGHALAEYYAGIVDERLCRRCIGNLERINARHWIEFESIDCPLSRDGERVDFIIGVTVGFRERRL